MDWCYIQGECVTGTGSGPTAILTSIKWLLKINKQNPYSPEINSWLLTCIINYEYHTGLIVLIVYSVAKMSVAKINSMCIPAE